MIENAAAPPLDEGIDSVDPIEAAVRLAAEAAWDKKAQGLKAVDVRGLVSYADFIIVCSGNTGRQVNAISDSIQRRLRDEGLRPLGVEGKSGSEWVLLDYGDFVVHVFVEAARDVYGLDSLWVSSPELELDEPPDLERPAYY